MGYREMRQDYADKLEDQVELGEITCEEADEKMADWEAGYGDYIYDLMQDRKMEEQYDW